MSQALAKFSLPQLSHRIISGSSSSVRQKSDCMSRESRQAMASASQRLFPEPASMGKERFGFSGRYRSACPGAKGEANSNSTLRAKIAGHRDRKARIGIATEEQ